jgi:micrococcal nuclease
MSFSVEKVARGRHTGPWFAWWLCLCLVVFQHCTPCHAFVGTAASWTRGFIIFRTTEFPPLIPAAFHHHHHHHHHHPGSSTPFGQTNNERLHALRLAPREVRTKLVSKSQRRQSLLKKIRLRGGASSQSNSKDDDSSNNLLYSAAAAATVLWSPETLTKMWTFLQKAFQTLLTEFQELSHIQKGMLLAVFLLGLQLGRASRLFWKRYTNAVDIPSVYYGPKAPYLKGRVLSVSDGDTIRFLHVPTIFHRSRISENDNNGDKKKIKKKQRLKVSEIALPIRVCTIDTPETAKFGKSGQPFGQEAKEYLASLVQDKMVRIRLLQKDQYGRAVAQVEKPGILQNFHFLVKVLLLPLLLLWQRFVQPPPCVDELLLRKGLAEVYQGMGAVYGPLGKEKYLRLQEEAQQQKLGIWSLKNRESAADYKRRTK